MYYFHSLSCIIYFTIFFNAIVSESSVCVQEGPCVCKYPNQTGIDLTQLSQHMLTSNPIQNESVFYYLNLCNDSKTVPNVPDSEKNDCTSGYSVSLMLIHNVNVNKILLLILCSQIIFSFIQS